MTKSELIQLLADVPEGEPIALSVYGQVSFGDSPRAPIRAVRGRVTEDGRPLTIVASGILPAWFTEENLKLKEGA